MAKKKRTRPTKRRPIERRPSALDAITTSTAHDVAHASTQDIVRRRDLLVMEVVLADAEIVELTAKMTAVKARRGRAEAVLAGLARVVEKR